MKPTAMASGMTKGFYDVSAASLATHRADVLIAACLAQVRVTKLTMTVSGMENEIDDAADVSSVGLTLKKYEQKQR